MKIFLTGATGYVGGRLAPRLLAAGHTLRCCVRNARKLDNRSWRNNTNVEVVETNLLDEPALEKAMRGCDVAYYLVHSMQAAGNSYRRHDVQLARSFAAAARRADVKRIVYLGGLGETGDDLSQHLASRRDVEAALSSTNIPVTVFRAAMIIGSGSASFEILRYLTERLPVMITPKWVRTECQPIAISDVLRYLVECLEQPRTIGQTLDIGSADVMTYEELIQITARKLNLPRRRIIPIPLLTPRLSSLWIYLITPVTFRVARPLAEGLRNRVVCRNELAHELMPGERLSVEQAIEDAVDQSQTAQVATGWSDAGVIPGDPDWAGGTTLTDERILLIDAPPNVVFDAVCRIGGTRGYYAVDWLWRLRGAIDRCVGGPGLRRGRRDPNHLRFGDALDFWRVTDLRVPSFLQLRAEMKLPGEAMLEFKIEPVGAGQSRLTQTARFKPKGLAGIAYWYTVSPLHRIVFEGMLNGVEKQVSAATLRSKIATPVRERYVYESSTN